MLNARLEHSGKRAMNINTTLRALLLVLIFGAGWQIFAQAKNDGIIKGIALKWEAAWNRHDMKALADLVAEDVDLITVSGTWLKSRKEFEENHTRSHAIILKESVLTTKNTEVKFIKADVAVAHVEWSITGIKEPDGTPRQQQHGIFTWVLENRKGHWLIIKAQNTSVSYPPLPTGAKPETLPEKNKIKPKMIALKTGEPTELAHDAGTVRFLASSEETNGAWSLVEVKEMPGYKTNIHRHNNTDEAFYVLEGVLTAIIAGKTHELPAGSYILIPRGTPHAQGNFGKVPIKLLLTMTPGGFERSFKDRVELFKTIKPDHPDFRKMREELRIKGKHDVEFISAWETKK